MKKLIVANWKMNPRTWQEAEELFNAVKETEAVICPPFVYLRELGIMNHESGIRLGAQNVFWESQGAFTGEVSSLMLKDLGCEYIIIGHSERRKYFNETDENVNKKVKAVIEAGLIPIVCVGETEGERENNKTEEILEKEIKDGLNEIDYSQIVIAYEPIWAIGTGNACDIEEAERMKEVIQKMTSKNVKIIYGGSANADNADGYLSQANLDGLLVGGASLKPDEFKRITG